MAHTSSSGKRFRLILLLLVLGVCIGGAAYLGLVTPPAPTQPVEHEISYDALQPQAE